MVVGRGSWVQVVGRGCGCGCGCGWRINYDNSYETHCDICPMSYRVTPTSGEVAQKLGRILPFVPKLGSFLSNVPPEISWAISKLVWLTSWTILSRFRHGIFISFWYRFNVNIIQSVTDRETTGPRKTESARQRMLRIKTFKKHLLERGYPQNLINNTLSEVKFQQRTQAPHQRNKTKNESCPT